MECIFFVNPKAGNNEGERLAKVLEELPLRPPLTSKQVIFTDPSRISSQVFSLASSKDLIIICGGDGTISNIISALVQLDRIPPVAIIPLGTGNDIARATNWLRSWKNFGLEGVFYAIKKRQITSFDTWKLTFENSDGSFKEYVFSGYAGLGYDGKICMEVCRFKISIFNNSHSTALKKLFYLISGIKLFLKNLLWQERVKFLSNNNLRHAGQILFCNINSYAGGSILFTKTNLGDGFLEMVFLRGFFSYIKAIIKGRIKNNGADLAFFKIANWQFEILNSCHLQIDGEPIGLIPKGTIATLEHHRVVPLLKPLEDKEAFEKMPAFSEEGHLEKASTITPAIT